MSVVFAMCLIDLPHVPSSPLKAHRDCGLDLEVQKAEGQTIELQKLAIEKEDWGE